MLTNCFLWKSTFSLTLYAILYLQKWNKLKFSSSCHENRSWSARREEENSQLLQTNQRQKSGQRELIFSTERSGMSMFKKSAEDEEGSKNETTAQGDWQRQGSISWSTKLDPLNGLNPQTEFPPRFASLFRIIDHLITSQYCDSKE